MSEQIPRVGRNEPCPCGSGQKYKKCHGSSTYNQVVADVAKVGPQWVSQRVERLLSSSKEERARARHIELFDDADRLAQLELSTKDKRERELIDNLKLGLGQSVVEPFEVTEVHRGYGLGLRGALTGRRFYLDNPEVAELFEPLEWLVGRVFVFGKRAYLLDEWERVPFRRRKQLKADLLSAYQTAEGASAPPQAEGGAEGKAEGGEGETSTAHPTLMPAAWLKGRAAWVWERTQALCLS